MALPYGGQIYFMEIHQGSRRGGTKRYLQLQLEQNCQHRLPTCTDLLHYPDRTRE